MTVSTEKLYVRDFTSDDSSHPSDCVDVSPFLRSSSVNVIQLKNSDIITSTSNTFPTKKNDNPLSESMVMKCFLLVDVLTVGCKVFFMSFFHAINTERLVPRWLPGVSVKFLVFATAVAESNVVVSWELASATKNAPVTPAVSSFGITPEMGEWPCFAAF